LAIEFGFTVVILLSLGLYVMAAVVANTGTIFRLPPSDP
jgi:hypothetical protein